jgi:hypothetical protein
LTTLETKIFTVNKLELIKVALDRLFLKRIEILILLLFIGSCAVFMSVIAVPELYKQIYVYSFLGIIGLYFIVLPFAVIQNILFSSNRLLFQPHKMRIDNDALEIVYTEGSKSLVRLENIYKLVNDNKYYLLYISKNQFFYIPKNAFMNNEEIAAFESTIKPGIIVKK